MCKYFLTIYFPPTPASQAKYRFSTALFFAVGTGIEPVSQDRQSCIIAIRPTDHLDKVLSGN